MRVQMKMERIHLQTWHSPDGHTFNQIDHCLIDAKHFSDVIDVMVRRRANIDSDHMLVVIKLRARIGTTHHGITTIVRVWIPRCASSTTTGRNNPESSDKHHQLHEKTSKKGWTRSMERRTRKRTPHSEKKGPIIGQYSVLSKLIFSDKNTKNKKYA
jgi:hypothetical protein